MGKQTRVRHSTFKAGRADNDWRVGDHARATSSLAFLVGSRGNLSSATDKPAPQGDSKLSPETMAARASKLANAKARQQRKRQRRYERQKDEQDVMSSAQPSRPAQPSPAPSDTEKPERVKPFALRDVPSKAERRKAIKKAKKAAKSGEPTPPGTAVQNGAQTLKRVGVNDNGPVAKRARTEDQSPSQLASASSQPGSRLLSYGVRVSELSAGSGPLVQDRKRVKVSYVGKLGTVEGKVFDKGSISFRLGRGEVIKGWDIGVQGMKVGGRRRIIVPPSAGYGPRATGDIPPNSTLCFDVTVVGCA